MRRKQSVLNEENHAMEKINQDIKLKKKHQRRIKRNRFIWNFFKVSLVILLIFGIYAFDASNTSRIRTLEISGNTTLSDQEIMDALKIEKGDRLAFTHSFVKESKAKKNPGLESIDVNVYYTKGYVSVDVHEVPAVAYQSEGGLKLYYADGYSKDLDENQSNLVLGLPILVGYTEDTISKMMLQYLGELVFEAFSAISEIHHNPQTYDPLAMKLYMNDQYLVYANVETLPMMYMYATLLSSASDGNKCIELNEYGPDEDSSTVTIRACTTDEY